MKHLRILILIPLTLLLTGSVTQQHLMVVARKNVSAPAGFTGDLLDENAEGTGTPSGWTNTGTPNWDYTTTVLQGSESLLCSGHGSSYDFTGQTTVEGYSMIRWPVTLPPSVSSIMSFRTSGGTPLAILRVDNSGNVTIFADGSDSTACVNTMTTGVTYHVWLRYVSGGTCSVEFSTDGTRTGSGNGYTSKTGGTGTAARYQQEVTQHIADRMIADTGTIPSNP